MLNAVAEKIGWGKPPPAGVTRGIAQHMGYGSYVACAAEVTLSDRGRVKIDRLVLATDSGHVVNPDQVIAQVEGSVAYGLGAMLYQESTVKDGRIVEENFDTYPMMLMEDFPKIETVLDALRRLLGRRRRADHLRGGAGGAERHLRGDRQARLHAAAEEREAAEGVRWGQAGTTLCLATLLLAGALYGAPAGRAQGSTP